MAPLYRRAACGAWHGSQGVPAPDSGGVPAEHEAAAVQLGWASKGWASGLGSGQSWAGLGGPRPAEELRGHGRTSADRLGPTRKKAFFPFFEFNFQCKNISKIS
jgi:hypothetical protein